MNHTMDGIRLEMKRTTDEISALNNEQNVEILKGFPLR